jgi:hypothetical protein
MASLASMIPKQTSESFNSLLRKQGVQDDALFSPRPGKNIVDLVEDEDLDANVAKRVDGAPLHIDDAGARAMRRVNGGEDLREELWCELLGHGIVVGKSVERQSADENGRTLQGPGL